MYLNYPCRQTWWEWKGTLMVKTFSYSRLLILLYKISFVKLSVYLKHLRKIHTINLLCYPAVGVLFLNRNE